MIHDNYKIVENTHKHDILQPGKYMNMYSKIQLLMQNIILECPTVLKQHG